MGLEHPEIAITMNNLALVLRAMGKIEAAQALFTQALSVFEKTVGAEHPNTMLCRQNAESVGYSPP